MTAMGRIIIGRVVEYVDVGKDESGHYMREVEIVAAFKHANLRPVIHREMKGMRYATEYECANAALRIAMDAYKKSAEDYLKSQFPDAGE